MIRITEYIQSPTFNYTVVKPSGWLEPYIKCYANMEYCINPSLLHSDCYLPFGSPYIQICYKGFLIPQNGPLNNNEIMYAHAVGQRKTYHTYYHSGSSGHFAIIFQPVGLHYLFNHGMNELTDKAQHLELLINNQEYEIFQEIKSANRIMNRVELAERLLTNRLKKTIPKCDDADFAIQLINNEPTKSIDEVCKYLKISTRQLRRKFKSKVGIGPKTYLRIKRFHKALKLSYQQNNQTLHDISFLCGYYDQSHFIQDFKQFTGKTPFEYIVKNNRNLEMGFVS